MSKRLNNKKNDIIKEDIIEDTKAVNEINKKSVDDTSSEILKKRLRKIHFDPVKFTANSKEYYRAFVFDDSEVPDNYDINLEKKLKDALGIRKILKDFEMAMYINEANVINNTDKTLKNKLPRQMKMKRVEQMYDLLINFSLKLLHNLFYIDLDTYEENTYTIEECMNLAAPIIISLKRQFEDQVNDELKLLPEELNALRG